MQSSLRWLLGFCASRLAAYAQERYASSPYNKIVLD